VNIQNRLKEAVRQGKARLKRDILKPVFTSPAAWCFAAIWVTGVIYLAAIGRIDTTVPTLCLLATIMFLCAITVLITKKEHKPKVKLSRTRLSLLLLQIAVIMFSIVRTATFGLAYGIIFQRTRNLLACSVFHVVFNSLGA